MRVKVNKRAVKTGVFLLLLGLMVAGTVWYGYQVAVGRFRNATDANCLVCHTTNDLTVTIWQDSACTVPQPTTVNIQAGSTLTFYIKVAGEPPGNRIGAGIKYPPEAYPLGSNGDQQNPNTWTAYTPPGLRLANNAVFAWNRYNVNMTKVYGTTSTDVSDSDRNGYEVFPVVLNVPPSTPPGTYTIQIYGAGTNRHGGSLTSGLTLIVGDTMKPNQITDLKVTYDPTTTTMNLSWTTPNPPDNSGSISKFEIYRSTQPIYDLSLATLIATKTDGLAGGTKNTFADDVSAFPDGTILYYAVVSYDAAGNRSDISTGVQTSATKQPASSPSPYMYKPNTGSTLSGTVKLVAKVFDDSGVTSVTFQRSATLDFTSPVDIGSANLEKGTAKDGYWSCNWDTTSVSDGTWYVRAVASDGTYTSYSNVFQYTVDNTAPSLVLMQAPADGSTLQNVVTLQARAVDNLGIDRVEFQVSSDPTFNTGVQTFTGAVLTAGTATDGTWSLSWSSSIFPNGTVYIRAKAYDGGNLSAVSPAFTYTISNAPGTVPHGGYKEYSAPCAKCHSAHNGENLYLSTNISVNALCTTCHDGTSAQKTHGFPSVYEHLWPEKRVFCSKCHNPHMPRDQEPRPLLRDTYVSETKNGVPSDYQLCFDCHANPAFPGYEETQSVYDIYQFYKKTSNNGQGTRGIDAGHFVRSTTGTYTFADGTPVPQGYQLRCKDCHDQHGSDNKKLLKKYLGTNPNPVILNDPGGDELTVREERAFCMGCHNGSTELYNPYDLTPIKWDPYISSGHTDASKKCSECHGGLGTAAMKAMRAAHAPDYESQGNMDCILCHETIVNRTSATNTSSYHHIAANYNPLDADKYKRTQSCLQCHVDHDKFRPDLAPGNQRAYNLRTNFDPAGGGTTPANTDFIAADTNGGLCLSCHKVTQTKTIVIGGETTVTQAVSVDAYKTATGHNYAVTSNFGDSTTFNANCVKCHNDTLTKSKQTSPNKFGAHDSTYQSILSPFDQPGLSNPLDYNFCLRCHSAAGDYYGTAMSTAAKNVATTFQNSVSKHDLTLVKCVNCHNPHVVSKNTYASGQATTDISDPDNTLKYFASVSGSNTTQGRSSQFCIKCHDGSPPVRTLTDTTVVPYTVTFPAVNFTTNGGGWNKSGYTSSAHWSQNIECLKCHSYHGSPYPYLTLASEENNCLTAGCHGSGGVKNVDNDLNQQYRHPVKAYSGRHSNTEDYTTMTNSSNKRHAECNDCHDPHTAAATSSTEVDKLGRVTGVRITNYSSYNWNNWNSIPMSNFTLVTLDPATANKYEYQLCFKCHSKFSYGSDPPVTPSGGFVMTDQAKEFSPSNPAGHVVVEGVPNNTHIPTFTYNSVTYYYGKFVAPWTATSKLKCTDCHTSDSGFKGPHGSGQKFILKKNWNPTASNMASTDLCFDCHDYNFYYGGGSGSATVRSQFSSSRNYNLHNKHSGNKQKTCASCHGAIPHGWNHTDPVGGGLALFGKDDPAPYNSGSWLNDVGDKNKDGTGAYRAPGQWSGQHSGTSCGGTTGCT